MKIAQLMRSVRREVEKPYEEKLEQAEKLIICELKKHPWSCVSCSFGKDSTVVLDLVRRYNPDVYVVFNNTRVQHPETYQFKDYLKKKWRLKILETKPVMSFWQVADKYGLPKGAKLDYGLRRKVEGGKARPRDWTADKCCDYLKKYPFERVMRRFKFTLGFTGMTAVGSRPRNLGLCRYGQVYYGYEGYWKAHPIAYWTEADVWRYIEENQIPVNPIYQKAWRLGLKDFRSGCFTCTAHKGWQRQMSLMYPGIYRLIQERYMGQKVLA